MCLLGLLVGDPSFSPALASDDEPLPAVPGVPVVRILTEIRIAATWTLKKLKKNVTIKVQN